MGMSTHVIGFKPADEKWHKMKAVWDACEKAGIDTPEEVIDFFADEPPDENGVVVYIEETDYCKEWKDDMKEGFEIEVYKLPKDVKIIRFYNS